jgi:hypothetical protein
MPVGGRRASVPKGCAAGIRGCGVALVAVSLVALASAAPALAEPEGIFGVFRQCPTRVLGVTLCTFDQLNSGEFVIGGVKVPIDKTITVQVGFVPTGNPQDEREFFAVSAKDGESLSKTELNVPGELLGAPVTVIAELVEGGGYEIVFNETALAEEEGAGLILPVRFHLKNPFVGGSCYIGSESHPVQLRLTTGATHPPTGFEPIHGIKGKAKTLEEKEELALRLTGTSLVDNTFPVPGAEGCGASSALDARVDEDLEIPDNAGENSATLGGELNLAPRDSVIASESWPAAPTFALPVPGGLAASNVTQAAATLNGTLNPGGAPDDYHFEYGTTTAYGSFEPIPEGYTPLTGETLTVSQSVAGLQAGTTYHYRLVADNPGGVRVAGPNETFTTLPAPAVPTGGTGGTGALALTESPSGGMTLPATTSPASSSTPPAHHTLDARRRAKQRKVTKKKQAKHTANTKSCHRDKGRAARLACERAAREKYGRKTKVKKQQSV